MTTGRQRTRATYEDYLNTPEGERYELVDGELLMVPAPSISHQTLLVGLVMALGNFVVPRSLGRVLCAPTDVALLDEGTVRTVLQPDVLFVSKDRDSLVTEGEIRGAPDIVVEILSPSTAQYDRTTKREIYARNGVGEYWLVDTDARSITVLLLGGGDYEVGGIYGPGDTLTSPALPGLQLDVAEVFGTV